MPRLVDLQDRLIRTWDGNSVSGYTARIVVPDSVKVMLPYRVKNNTHKIVVCGPKGTLEIRLPPLLSCIQQKTHKGIGVIPYYQMTRNTLIIKKSPGFPPTKLTQAQVGLYRTLVANMVHGVTVGFKKRLQITGVGYRAQLCGEDLVLHLGYSHPSKMVLPKGVAVELESPTSIIVSGMQKDMVGAFAAKIRSVRPPEPYKGKGIAYEDEIIRRKAGKTGKSK